MTWEEYKQVLVQQHKKEQADNMDLFKQRIEQYNNIDGIRVGDYIKENDTYIQVTHIWYDDNEKQELLQTQDLNFGHGSFYLGNGYISYSGSLNTGYHTKNYTFNLLDEKKQGVIWFFKRNIHTAHNGINFNMNFRVFEAIKKDGE